VNLTTPHHSERIVEAVVECKLQVTHGTVDRTIEHFSLHYGPGIEDDPDIPEIAIALVGPPHDESVTVEFLVDTSDPKTKKAVDAVMQEIDYYLCKLENANPWRYCLRHSATFSNAFSRVHWGFHMSQLEKLVVDFDFSLGRFKGFERHSFTVGELQQNRSWDWGYHHGVYCFVVGDELVYVGRALGSNLGQRIADQLRQTTDPAWAAVVENDDTRIEVFAVQKECAYLGAALEAYLISQEPRPRFNSRLC